MGILWFEEHVGVIRLAFEKAHLVQLTQEFLGLHIEQSVVKYLGGALLVFML